MGDDMPEAGPGGEIAVYLASQVPQMAECAMGSVMCREALRRASGNVLPMASELTSPPAELP